MATTSKIADPPEASIIASLVSLSVPIVVANLLQAAYQISDAYWVGSLGGHAVAAVSISSPVIFLSMALGSGLAMAGSTLVAQYFGAKNQAMVDHVAAQTLVMVVMVSAVLGLAGYLSATSLLHLMNVQADVREAALGFMRVSFLGTVFNFFFFMFQSIMRGIGRPTLPVWIVLGTVVLNFVLDPLFIYGRFGVPPLGVMGAAVATLVTQMIAAIVSLAVLFRGRNGVKLDISHFKPDLPFIRSAFLLGFPASIEMSARALGLTVMTLLIAGFGTLTIAAYGVGSNILNVVMIPAMGMSMAVSTLVGQNVGAGNVRRAEQISRLGAWLGFGSLTVIGAIVFLFAPTFVRFFVHNDTAVVDQGAALLRTTSLAWGFMGLQMALTGVLRACGDMVAPMALTLISQWGLQFPIAYFLAKHTPMGASGIWWSIPVSQVLITLLTVAVMARSNWRERRLV